MQYKQIATIAAVLAVALILTTAGTSTAYAVPASLTADNQSVSVDENSSVAITLTGNGPSGFTYEIAAQPTNGVLTGTAPNLTYTPATDYVGLDSFTFHTKKGGNDSADATVSITVNEVVVNPPPPVECDEGFHLEGEVCVADETETEEPPVLTCDEGFHVEGEVCVADETDEEEVPPEDEEETPVTTTSGGKNRSLSTAAGVTLAGMDSIPESETGLSLYDAINGPTGINLLSAMRAMTSAGLDWNSLTEGQQVWLLENFNSLLN